jgi:hypothetical protein
MRKITNLALLYGMFESNKKKKELMLDRPTSHGGWPKGNNNSWVGNKPVNDIIYDYLEAMGLTADVPQARLSEVKIRKLIKESLKRHAK